jgi:hypothetical protein
MHMQQSTMKKLCLGVVIGGMTLGLGAQDYQIEKHLTGSGHEATGGSFTLKASSGQAVVGSMAGGSYWIASGYWQPDTDLIFKNSYE